MSETLTFTPVDVHDLGHFRLEPLSTLERHAQEVLAVANNPEYQRLMREFLAIPEDQISQRADALTALNDYAYTVDMPEGQHRDSSYTHAAFMVVLKALTTPEPVPQG